MSASVAVRGMDLISRIASRGQAALTSVSDVKSSTFAPCRWHSSRKASPFRYVAMQRIVGIYTLRSMRTDYRRWHSDRLGRDMGIVVYGHWGPPTIVFPTSGGDEWEFDRQGVITALTDIIDGGQAKLYCVNINHGDSFANKGAHPLHRSWMQHQYDAYITHEVIPFIRTDCGSSDIGIGTVGASLGAYHAANTLFKHPDAVKRCFAMSGVYDMKRF